MTKSRHSLCWACDRPGTGSCSWDKELKPVEGWEAEESVFHGSEDSVTYHVIRCPLFLQGRPIKESRTERMTTPEDLEAMLSLLKEGYSGYYISKEMGLSPRTPMYYREKFIKQGLLQP